MLPSKYNNDDKGKTRKGGAMDVCVRTQQIQPSLSTAVACPAFAVTSTAVRVRSTTTVVPRSGSYARCTTAFRLLRACHIASSGFVPALLTRLTVQNAWATNAPKKTLPCMVMCGQPTHPRKRWLAATNAPKKTLPRMVMAKNARTRGV